MTVIGRIEGMKKEMRKKPERRRGTSFDSRIAASARANPTWKTSYTTA